MLFRYLPTCRANYTHEGGVCHAAYDEPSIQTEVQNATTSMLLFTLHMHVGQVGKKCNGVAYTLLVVNADRDVLFMFVTCFYGRGWHYS